jgi:uncharacterized protein YggE
MYLMNNSLRTAFFIVLFIFVGLFLFTKLAGPLPFSVTTVTTTKDSLFTADGTGEATAIPDTAMVSFGVTKDAPTVEAAQKQVNEVINKISDDLKALGVQPKDIKTTNYSVNPNYTYNQGGKQTLNGYNVNADVQVKLKPVEQGNKAIDIATNDGATNVGGVQFVLDDNKKKELQNQARKEAIKLAKEKAQSLADAAGIKLGRIIDIQESGGGAPAPMFELKTADRAGGEAQSTELNPGENKISITVTLSYETF